MWVEGNEIYTYEHGLNNVKKNSEVHHAMKTY